MDTAISRQTNEAESGLLDFLRSKYQGHVSYERVVSGPGLFKIYEYFRQSGFADPTVEADAIQSSHEPSAMISQLGLAEKDPLCVEALRMFARIFGAEAGNLALKCGALGGLLIGGGIAPKILPVLQGGAFMEGFLDKGRLGKWLEKIPVSVGLNPDAALIGAARHGFDFGVPDES